MSTIVSQRRFCQQDLGFYQRYIPQIFEIMRGGNFPSRIRFDQKYVVLDQIHDPKFPTFNRRKEIFFCVTDPLPSGEFKIFVATKHLIDSSTSLKVLRVLDLLKGTSAGPNPILIQSFPEENPKYSYIIYELFNQSCLADMVNDKAYVGGLLSSHLIGYKTLGALKECHDKGIIHRDLKASNILIRELKDGSIDVRLTDFETTLIKGEDSEDEATRLCGYPPSVTQEDVDHYNQTGKLFPADFERDLRAFGSLLHELETSKPAPTFLHKKGASSLGIFHQEIYDLLSAKPKSGPSLLSIQRRMFTLLKKNFPDAPEVQSLKIPELPISVSPSPDYSTSLSDVPASLPLAKPIKRTIPAAQSLHIPDRTISASPLPDYSTSSSAASASSRLAKPVKRNVPHALPVQSLEIPGHIISAYPTPDYSTSSSNAPSSPTFLAKRREISFSSPEESLQPSMKKTESQDNATSASNAPESPKWAKPREQITKKPGFLASLFRSCCCAKDLPENPPLQVQPKPDNLVLPHL